MAGRRGFSLTELLVVIGIILVLAAVLFPVFSHVKARAKITDCESRLHQVAFAMQMYRGDNDDETWLQFSNAPPYAGCSTTAGRCSYPWDTWTPIAPYLKTGSVVRCPLPDRSEIIVYNLYHLHQVSRQQLVTDNTVTTYFPLDPEPGRVVAYCNNHGTDVLEKPDPAMSSFVELWKGIYPVVRDDGSTSVVKSSQIELWYLWQDGSWHPQEQGTQMSSQSWRFPGEPWPPDMRF